MTVLFSIYPIISHWSKNVEMISNLQFNQICVNVMIFIDHIKADAW